MLDSNTHVDTLKRRHESARMKTQSQKIYESEMNQAGGCSIRSGACAKAPPTHFRTFGRSLRTALLCALLAGAFTTESENLKADKSLVRMPEVGYSVQLSAASPLAINCNVLYPGTVTTVPIKFTCPPGSVWTVLNATYSACSCKEVHFSGRTLSATEPVICELYIRWINAEEDLTTSLVFHFIDTATGKKHDVPCTVAASLRDVLSFEPGNVVIGSIDRDRGLTTRVALEPGRAFELWDTVTARSLNEAMMTAQVTKLDDGQLELEIAAPPNLPLGYYVADVEFAFSKEGKPLRRKVVKTVGGKVTGKIRISPSSTLLGTLKASGDVVRDITFTDPSNRPLKFDLSRTSSLPGFTLRPHAEKKNVLQLVCKPIDARPGYFEYTADIVVAAGDEQFPARIFFCGTVEPQTP